MKKLLGMLAVALIVLPLGAAPLKFSGYTWLRYTVVPPFDTSGTSTFEVPRSYWSVEYPANDALTFRGTIDIVSAATGWNARVKFLQADWSPALLARIIPDFAVIFGVQPTFFGLADIWAYPLIERPFEDVEGKVGTADIGVSLRAGLPLGLGNVKLGVMNGTFYSTPIDNNWNKAVDACLTLTPVRFAWVRGSAWLATTPQGIIFPTQVAQNRYSGALGVNLGPLTLMGEYLAGVDDVTRFSGWSGFAQLDFFRRAQLGARYDHLLADQTVAESAHDRVIFGGNLKLNEALLLQVNYQYVSFANPALERQDKFMVQFRYAWGTTLQPAR